LISKKVQYKPGDSCKTKSREQLTTGCFNGKQPVFLTESSFAHLLAGNKNSLTYFLPNATRYPKKYAPGNHRAHPAIAPG
jgi:hypothetical protein